MMGTGKSTLGKIVAKMLNIKFIDTDFNIEKNCSMKIHEIFKKKGEEFFRHQEEQEVIKSLKKNNSVVAVGGGAFINKKIRDAILKLKKSGVSLVVIPCNTAHYFYEEIVKNLGVSVLNMIEENSY